MALCANTYKLLLDSSANGQHGQAVRTRSSKQRRGVAAVKMAASSSDVAAEFEAGQLERPKWAGETPLSRIVGAIINFKPVYSVLKLGARQVLIRY